MVTSRTTGDDLIEDQDTAAADSTEPADIDDDLGPNGVMAPPRRPARKPAPAKPAPAKPADATSSDDAGKPDVVAADKEAVRPVPVDATLVDGIPALPADTVSSPRGGKPKEPAGSTGSGSAGEAATSAASSTTSAPGSSGTTSAQPRSAGSDSSVPAAEASSVPPAAFAWEMPDPPPHSPSSPARAFLRSGLTAKTPAPAKPSSPASPGTSASSATSAASAAPSTSAPPKTGPGETRPRGPVTLGPSRGGPSKTGSSAKAQQKKGSKKAAARQAHLTISRVEPWSVMKFSFVVSLVAFVILFVAVSVLYGALSGLGVFDSLQRVVSSVTSSQGSTGVNAKAWFSASRVLGYTALLGSLNIVLITAMSTIGSVVYNLTSRLVGGVEVTLRETE